MTDSGQTIDPALMPTERRRILVRGTVQGVGFRPFVFRLAEELHLVGSVGNDSEGVVIDIQGKAGSLDQFERRLMADCPPLARITATRRQTLPNHRVDTFVIHTSRIAESTAPVIPADAAVCADCLAEMHDPKDRRYRYPFINCTNCGPRYTITESVPYDRPMTSMKHFQMCEACESEYHDPHNRRFHAQPNACPVCGPRVRLHDGKKQIETDDPFSIVRSALQNGRIVALRSLGGFHLVCDATNDAAVELLRRRKRRPHKPFAVMCPDLVSARLLCGISADEAATLVDPTRPIVLLKRRVDARLANNIAPDTDRLGLMLPSAPVQHLLFDGDNTPLVMTSGNLTDEPIVIGNDEALDRLADFADLFVLHDREILQRVDDSIVVKSGGDLCVVRRARGMVPSPVQLPVKLSAPILACGGELKGTVAVGLENQAVISQHLGDLDNPLSMDNFELTVQHLERLLDCSPTLIAHDLHPDYLSSRWAKKLGNVRCVAVQHHHAHLVSVMAECGVTEPCLGIILDGTGYGLDGTLWGGEILYGDAQSFRRLAWLDPVPMPGGEVAIREPWRMAVSYLLYAFEESFPANLGDWNKETSRQTIEQICDQARRKFNAPITSSCGRLFDGVASMLNLCQQVSYEAQAAIRLETAATPPGPLAEQKNSVLSVPLGSIDYSPLVRRVWEQARAGENHQVVARQFHSALADLLIGSAVSARDETGSNRVALSGGVYQNSLFFEYMLRRLKSHGFETLSHTQVPTNDGGLVLGQLLIADAAMKSGLKGEQ